MTEIETVAREGRDESEFRHRTRRACGSHVAYGLTCEKYDALIEWAGNRCQICGTDGDEAAMVVDHDHRLGGWAVRGLLCSMCNVALDYPGPSSPAQDAYLAAPWHAANPDHPLVPTQRVPTANAERLYVDLDNLSSAFERTATRKERRSIQARAATVAVSLLREGEMPSRVVARAPFSLAYLRKYARAAGVPAAAPGHKIGSRPFIG